MGERLKHWNLPENFSDILALQTSQIEVARSSILRLFSSFGYRQVIPPLVEYSDSLDERSFRFMDIGGSELALRADITLQIARIDAHLLSSNLGVNRLCYVGSVVTTNPSFSSRESTQIGAEIYGSYSTSADLEIIEIMLKSLALILEPPFILDLGHLGIYEESAKNLEINQKDRLFLFRALQSKNPDLISMALDRLDSEKRLVFQLMSELCGYFDDILDERLGHLSEGLCEKAGGYLRSLKKLIHEVSEIFPGVKIFLDLTDLGGLASYHTGLVFRVYHSNYSFPVAKGGRYDGIGAKFGRVRAATGFSIDLRKLKLKDVEDRRVIYLGESELKKDRRKVDELRKSNVVITIFDD